MGTKEYPYVNIKFIQFLSVRLGGFLRNLCKKLPYFTGYSASRLKNYSITLPDTGVNSEYEEHANQHKIWGLICLQVACISCATQNIPCHGVHLTQNSVAWYVILVSNSVERIVKNMIMQTFVPLHRTCFSCISVKHSPISQSVSFDSQTEFLESIFSSKL